MVKQSVLGERIEQSILLKRHQKVMLDADLAALYGVETKQLVRAVKRNIYSLFVLYLPERIEIVEEVPLTNAGKIDKKRLREVIKEKLKKEGTIGAS